MYVCVCNAVTSRQINEAIADGADTFEALRSRLGVAMNCGLCAEEVRRLLHLSSLKPGRRKRAGKPPPGPREA